MSWYVIAAVYASLFILVGVEIARIVKKRK